MATRIAPTILLFVTCSAAAAATNSGADPRIDGANDTAGRRMNTTRCN